MAKFFIELLQYEFNLTEEDINLLQKTMRKQSRTERRYYYQNLKTKEKDFIHYLQEIYQSLEPEGQKQWLDTVVQSMLDRGGDPDISDALVMKIIGPLTVYNQLRIKSETDGIKLNILVNFGGLGTVIILFGAITALVMYLFSR
ncbi:hypothetical protein [Desulfallas thermosapovorans]|uniref:Uncharacterized protein n=1 Tax=Desulfallas thermosapovorans DSM 6562 TaxID=1121431 RepID=A0A5S4ZYD8_9FIRM|nr:hypothetical protein [Desulfallas thermosapovorans]TYO97749.1 hypothetical protein LX24_00030 [Desulfallas thermosapovorans DSM 6562]